MKFNYNKLAVGSLLGLGLYDHTIYEGNVATAQEYLMKNKYVLIKNSKELAFIWVAEKVSYLSSDYILVRYKNPAILLNYEYEC